MKLVDHLDSFQRVLDHPRHRAAQDSLAELIRQLRACTNPYEVYEFQQALLPHVLAVVTACVSWLAARFAPRP